MGVDEEDDADPLGGARGSIPHAPEGDFREPVFIPGWEFSADNPGRDFQSCRNFVLHVTPPAVEEIMEALTPRQSINRGYKAVFDSIMWNVNNVKVADKIERLNRKMGLALKEERAKVAAQEEGFAKYKAEHAADIARVDELVAEMESLRSRLSQQVKRADDIEAALQLSDREVNTARAERDEAFGQRHEVMLERDQAVRDREQALLEREQALLEREQALGEKKKLQAGLPNLVITSLSCPGISIPFTNVVKCARLQGHHEVASLAARHIDPLPEPVAARIDTEASAKARAAAEVLQNLSTSPFLERLVEDLDMPVEALLQLKPSESL